VKDFIEPFRVSPEKKVVLERDFDPEFTGSLGKKREGGEMPALGAN